MGQFLFWCTRTRIWLQNEQIAEKICLQKWGALWFIIKYFKSWLLPNMLHQGFTHKPSRCFILAWTTIYWVTILGPLGKESSLDSWGKETFKTILQIWAKPTLWCLRWRNSLLFCIGIAIYLLKSIVILTSEVSGLYRVY